MRSAREKLKFFEDITKMATGAMGSFSDVRQQVKTMVKERLDQIMEEMDMVTRSEFDRVEAMARKARERQEDLEDRIKDLEKQLKAGKKPAAKRKSK